MRTIKNRVLRKALHLALAYNEDILITYSESLSEPSSPCESRCGNARCWSHCRYGRFINADCDEYWGEYIDTLRKENAQFHKLLGMTKRNGKITGG